MKVYYVYILRCADGSFYTGITNELERRVGEHRCGLDSSCYTFERRLVELVYSTDFLDVDQAIAWEKQVKGWSRAKKAALIEGDWPAIHELSRSTKRRAR